MGGRGGVGGGRWRQRAEASREAAAGVGKFGEGEGARGEKWGGNRAGATCKWPHIPQADGEKGAGGPHMQVAEIYRWRTSLAVRQR